MSTYGLWHEDVDGLCLSGLIPLQDDLCIKHAFSHACRLQVCHPKFGLTAIHSWSPGGWILLTSTISSLILLSVTEIPHQLFNWNNTHSSPLHTKMFTIVVTSKLAFENWLRWHRKLCEIHHRQDVTFTFFISHKIETWLMISVLPA